MICCSVRINISLPTLLQSFSTQSPHCRPSFPSGAKTAHAPFRSFPRSAFEQCASAQPTMLATSGPGNAAMSVELATNANHKVGSIIRYPSSGTSRRGDLPDAAAITRVTHRPSSGLSPRQRRAARSGSTGSATPSSVRSRNPSASWSTIFTTTTASRTTTRPACATAPSCDHPTSTR